MMSSTIHLELYTPGPYGACAVFTINLGADFIGVVDALV